MGGQTITSSRLGHYTGVHFASLTVNTLDDNDDGVCNSSHCSLREAIIAANTRSGADTITFSENGNGVITVPSVSSDLPALTDAAGLTIDGDGDVKVHGDFARRPFLVDPDGSLTLT
ncbi:MAG: CSLREA domain-containing protein, partial [Dehalococcoidia bacterium]|nr:CSLREA domain-containing protein [Dehalococcoidia bacterium]